MRDYLELGSSKGDDATACWILSFYNVHGTSKSTANKADNRERGSRTRTHVNRAPEPHPKCCACTNLRYLARAHDIQAGPYACLLVPGLPFISARLSRLLRKYCRSCSGTSSVWFYQSCKAGSTSCCTASFTDSQGEHARGGTNFSRVVAQHIERYVRAQ